MCQRPNDAAKLERGSTLVTFVIMLVAIIALMGLVLDGGYAYSQRLRVQNAADAAAEAGLHAYIHDGSPAAVDNAVQTFGQANGADAPVQWQWVDEPTDPCHEIECLEVTAARTFPTFFAGVVGISELRVRARSVVAAMGVVEEHNLGPLAFQWYDYDLNEPITLAISGERHFDVDSFKLEYDAGHDELKNKKLYHKHQYDRNFGNFLDILGNSNFKWSDAMEDVSNVSIRFKNICNAAGEYEIKIAGTAPYTGTWHLDAVGEQEWVAENVPIGDLEHIYLTPINLNLLKGTEPKDVQDDVDARDNAYTLQVFNADTGQPAFEFSVYEHVKKDRKRDQCTGEGSLADAVPASWIDFDGSPSSTDELAEAICNVEASPTLEVDDYVWEIAGISTNQAIEDCLNTWIGQIVYVPIYDGAVGSGEDAQLHIVGFAAFVLESFDLTQGILDGHFEFDVGNGRGGATSYGLQGFLFIK